MTQFVKKARNIKAKRSREMARGRAREREMTEK
jgi:hypothetical protein